MEEAKTEEVASEVKGDDEEEKAEGEESTNPDEENKAAEEGKVKTPIEEKKQSVFDEDIGGIEINIIGEDG